ncbi:MAG TPA: DUF1214 domain-containing protein [Hyphomicrobium sp.]|nr:DUF1214 domain-containing protein [Hyphomicrobium sp.]
MEQTVALDETTREPGEEMVQGAPAHASASSLPRLPSAFQHGLRELGRRFFRMLLAAAAITIAVAFGVLSARYMINHGSALSTITYGPWVYWKDAGRPGADPYTRAHFANSSALRLSTDSAATYEANSDAEGAYLHSSCDYVLEGPYAHGLWWSLSVFDSRGQLIANDADRYAFTSDTVAANPDGSYIITLGRDARPGNWLPTGGAGRLVIVFSLLDPATGLSEEERAERYRMLPDIRRENCS